MDKYKNANRQRITRGKSAKQKRQTFRRCNEIETAAMRETVSRRKRFRTTERSRRTEYHTALQYQRYCHTKCHWSNAATLHAAQHECIMCRTLSNASEV